MNKILITGGAGFVGANLLRRLLEDNHEIHLFLSKETNTWRIQDVLDRVRIYHCNLTDKEAVGDSIKKIKPAIIYHLATHGAYADQTAEEKIIQTNLMGFINLLNACKKYGFKKFVNTGSSSEYGFKKSAMKETDLLEAPYSCYAFSKASATLYAQYIAEKEKLPIVTLRLFCVYGDYEEPIRFLPRLITNCLKNIPTPLARQETARDFIYIKDVIEAYVRVTEVETEPGEIFNVGTGKQNTLKEVVDTVIALTGTKISLSWNSFPSRDWDSCAWQADISKIREKVGWYPKYTLQQGITKTIERIKKTHERQPYRGL